MYHRRWEAHWWKDCSCAKELLAQTQTLQLKEPVGQLEYWPPTGCENFSDFGWWGGGGVT